MVLPLVADRVPPAGGSLGCVSRHRSAPPRAPPRSLASALRDPPSARRESAARRDPAPALLGKSLGGAEAARHPQGLKLRGRLADASTNGARPSSRLRPCIRD